MGDNTKLRRHLFRVDPEHRCHWCHRPTRWDVQKDGKPYQDTATVDHIRSRLDPKGRSRQAVLACYACNALRNMQVTKALAGKRVPPMPKPVTG